MLVAVLALVGRAAEGDVIRPWAAPWSIQADYDAWRAARGEPGAVLACEPLWPEQVRLCFRRVSGDRLARVHVGEEAPEGLRARADRDGAAWVVAQLERATVADLGAGYLRLRDAEGRAALGVLHPEVLAAELGTPFLAVMPTSGMVWAWSGGNADLDRVLAVAAREQHAAARDPVSPVVHAWDGAAWRAFAEAVPATGPR